MLEYRNVTQTPSALRNGAATFVVAAMGVALIGSAIAFAWAGSSLTKAIGGIVVAIGLMLCLLSRTSWLRLKTRIAVMFLSLTGIILVTDICLRVTTSFPINASSNTIPHERLGYVLDPAMPDVDAHGFRNTHLNDTVDIVTIGDSHTQGFGVKSQNSWPQVLGRLLNKTVYNFGIGGYGPLQYEMLIDDALALKPQTIVIGLYVGNDLADAAQIKTNHRATINDTNPFRHAVKYRTAIGSLVHHFTKQTAFRDKTSTTIEHELNPTVISDRRLKYLSDAMNLEAADIKRGLSSTLHILSEANRKCASRKCRLVTLLIPTREYAYSKFIEPTKLSDNYKTLLQNERIVHRHIVEALRQQNITHTTALPCLQSAMKITAGVYPRFDDGHPRESGYVAYAAAVLQLLSPQMAQSTTKVRLPQKSTSMPL